MKIKTTNITDELAEIKDAFRKNSIKEMEEMLLKGSFSKDELNENIKPQNQEDNSEFESMNFKIRESNIKFEKLGVK